MAPEGRLFVIGTAWLAVLTILFGETTAGFGLALFAVALWLVFRDFRRRPAPVALGLVAPIDATVEGVSRDSDPVTGQPAMRIDLRQRPLGEFNVHSPYEGVLEKRFRPQRASRSSDEDSEEPGAVVARERGLLLYALRTDEGAMLTLGFPIRSMPRMLRLKLVPGDRVGRSKRLGFAGFGLRVHCWVPDDSELIVHAGQRVLGGSDLLGSVPSALGKAPVNDASTADLPMEDRG